MRSSLFASLFAIALLLPPNASAAELPAGDMEFATQATSAGMAEVELGKLGVEKGNDPAVKGFGQLMVEDHGKANDELNKILMELQVEVPKNPPADFEATKTALIAHADKEFDQKYMEHMISGHEKAIALFSKQAESGENPQLKQFAAKTLPTIEGHLEKAQQIHASLRKTAGTESPGSADSTQTTIAETGGTAEQPVPSDEPAAFEETAPMQEAARTPSALGGMTAEQLIGQNVVNKSGENVGTIDDIVLNASDKAVMAVLSVGGFLGIGDKHVAVPFDQLEPGENETILMSSATEEQLKSLPEYKEEGYTSLPADRPIEP